MATITYTRMIRAISPSPIGQIQVPLCCALDIASPYIADLKTGDRVL